MMPLKAGDTKEFKVGDNVLTVEALRLGSLKKIVKIISEVGLKFDRNTMGEEFLKEVPTLLEGYLDQIVPLLFTKEKHPFLTPAWVDENLTLPLMKEIFITAIAVNGLADFFLKTVRVPAPKPEEESGTKTTLSESSSSITSLDSPMVGDQAT